mmetsp:Transcript_29301/g.59086  ORF Transcript_29301/g.59086 Transcript_29301/m.59086 type:complete len:133 (-) Transcript_29301:186-584(-)
MLVIGANVGALVMGLASGVSVGPLFGAPVELSVGPSNSIPLGIPLGRSIGLGVGIDVGWTVGPTDGLNVGLAMGAQITLVLIQFGPRQDLMSPIHLKWSVQHSLLVQYRLNSSSQKGCSTLEEAEDRQVWEG